MPPTFTDYRDKAYKCTPNRDIGFSGTFTSMPWALLISRPSAQADDDINIVIY